MLYIRICIYIYIHAYMYICRYYRYYRHGFVFLRESIQRVGYFALSLRFPDPYLELRCGSHSSGWTTSSLVPVARFFFAKFNWSWVWKTLEIGHSHYYPINGIMGWYNGIIMVCKDSWIGFFDSAGFRRIWQFRNELRVPSKSVCFC